MSIGPSETLNLIVDASVGVKWLVEESYSAEASRLMSPSIRRHVPILFFTEVAQTIWKKVHIRQEITTEDGRDIFGRLLLLPLEVHPIESLLKSSFDIALQTRRTVYDCAYLALAKLQGWRFVTADERLYNSLRGDPLGELLLWVADIPEIFREEAARVEEEGIDDFMIPDVVVTHSTEEIELIHRHYTNERLTDDHLAHLSEDLGIEHLDLTDSLVTDSGLVHLGRMARLKLLSLRNTAIGDAGLFHLRDLNSLETLDLTGTYVTDAGLEFLRNLPRLRILYLGETDTTETGRFSLWRDLPGLRPTE